jgi:hypothetical protein
LNAAAVRQARDEALVADATAADVAAALAALTRALLRAEAAERNALWADGRKGDGAAQIAGFSDTHVILLRRFAASGIVRHGEVDELHRHVSELRRRLAARGSTVRIDTVAGEGYEVTAGFDELYRLLRQRAPEALRVGAFTVKQTAILQLFAARGSAHVEQVPCLQRHMSNIRAKLPRAIAIRTHSGEGLYTLERGRAELERLLAGEALKPTRRVGLRGGSTRGK